MGRVKGFALCVNVIDVFGPLVECSDFLVTRGVALLIGSQGFVFIFTLVTPRLSSLEKLEKRQQK